MQLKLNLCLISLIFLSSFSCNSKITESDSKQEGKASTNQSSDAITVEEKWELPSELKEVSGIAYMGNNQFACVQDEDGKVFIYNTSTSEIEREISFAGGGDYEGLALVDNAAYVVNSEGKIYEILNWESENPEVKEYQTPLTEDHNIEGLCYDADNKRLLLAIKDEEPGNKDYKGIYGFDLGSKQLAEEPVYKIDLTHEIFNKLNEKDQEDFMMPSEINIHPQTGEIYITEGRDPKLLILDKNGNIKSLYKMDKGDFPQAEGITFSPEGELFISNEGGKNSGTILKVSLKN